MGAWGVDTFDNDTACDWSYDLEQAQDLSLVERTLERVLAVGAGYLDADDAIVALAACEVVARLSGKWGVRNAYTETVDTWVLAHAADPPGDLTERAVASIDRVLTSPSELLELWQESDDEAGWRAAVMDLRSRVAS